MLADNYDTSNKRTAEGMQTRIRALLLGSPWMSTLVETVMALSTLGIKAGKDAIF